jgi:hypothetical protein
LERLLDENPITYTVMEVNDPRVYSASNERAVVKDNFYPSQSCTLFSYSYGKVNAMEHQ